MKKLIFLFLGLLPLLAVGQTQPVPAELSLGGLRLRLTDGGRQAVQQKVDALRRHPASFQARVVLADAYFPLIDRVLQQEGVPADFHFLALQESGLQGDAQSIHDAVGYWQFKRESAQDFGLTMNDAVDERKHIVASSKAAAQYLLRSNKVFRNWANSLLSYNLGLTGTKPYTLPTDAGATEVEISERTHPYVLTFLAHKVAYESAVGLNPRPPLQLQEFPAPAGQPLAVLAPALQQSPEQLARHNRWLLAPAVPTDKVYTMLVPITDPLQTTALAAQQKSATAGQLLNQPAPDPESADFVRVNGLRALVALPGDTKESLARRAGLKLRKFMQYNDLLAFDNIVVGQPYFVQKKRDKAAVEYHVARPGETVAIVSQKYGVRAKAIWAKNRMARNEELRPGRVLWMQHTRPKTVAVEYANATNDAALAAFERPVTAPPKPRPAEPQPDQGSLATTQSPEDATEDEVPAAPPAPATRPAPAAPRPAAPAAPVTSVVQPDSATDAHTENLNELPPAPAAVSATAPRPEPSVPAPAPRKPLPAPAPVADEPREEDLASEETDSEASRPTPTVSAPTAPAQAASAPAQPAPAPAAPAAPAPTVAATPAPVPAVAATPRGAAASTASTTAAVEPAPASGLHTVEPKENLYSVARRFGLRPADLIAWNKLPPVPSLRIGQVLRVVPPAPAVATSAPVATASPASVPTPTPTKPAATPVPAPEVESSEVASAPAAPAPVRHTVLPGETMYGISRKYGVTIKLIMEWNNKPDFSVKPGEILLIKPKN
ncbi:LysM peptidoglycan-binding domain-containing protein [Hymenobacter weizhouensis]|uniref:LysM peptidoglycan-binding domain-containing protein n=1 Tax=Hymenobacter sp. YIM 151500-1 TaxID=2987689 RepID=UPI002227DAB8|nr:LysM peptidoglycan-binding domain-containing protein [Hymenobacter sp. YIM 151500-1]UYZ63163.1 LysM peptidoglycan-binding domain-containing protein [Hymenobacter sp. YIM 151500-1]